MKSHLAIVAALLALTTPAVSQDPRHRTDYRPVEGPVMRVRYNLETREVTRLGPASEGVGRAFSNCFDNSLTTGYYTGGTNGVEFMDFAAKHCAGTGVVAALSFGYATTARDLSEPGGTGASLGITLYSGGSAFCATPGTLAGYYLFTGLPGAVGTQVSPGFFVTAVLGADAAVLSDGPIDWGYTPHEGPFGTWAPSGPLLTEFSVNTGWGDVFDIYNRSPATEGTCLGAFFFGGCSPPIPPPTTGTPCEGFYLRLFEQQPKSGSVTFRNAGPNVPGFVSSGSDADGDCAADGTAAEPFLGERWITTVALGAGDVASLVVIAGSPLSGVPLGGPFGGTWALCVGVQHAELVVGGSHCTPIPLDPRLLSASLCTQGASIALAPLAVSLQNALDVTFGIR